MSTEQKNFSIQQIIKHSDDGSGSEGDEKAEMDDFQSRIMDNGSNSSDDDSSNSDDSSESECSSEHDKRVLREVLGKDDEPDADISNMGGDAALMHLIELIDDNIHRRNRKNTSESAKKWVKVHHVLTPIRFIILLWYTFQTQFEQPAWCLKLIKTAKKEDQFDPQQCNDVQGTYAQWPTPLVDTKISKSIEIFCLIFIFIATLIHNQIRAHDNNSRWTWWTQIALTFLAIVDLLFALAQGTYPWVAAFVRPVMIVIQFRVLRLQMRRFIYTAISSFPMYAFVLTYILYYSWMLQRFFAGTLEGFKYYKTFADSFWNMFVLITTANFPDIMLPAYQKSRWTCIFFIVYLTFGLFLFMNLLLAIIYSNFKFKIEANLEAKIKKRNQYLHTRFEELATGDDDNKYLDKVGMFKFFVIINSLVQRNDNDVFEGGEEEDELIRHGFKKHHDSNVVGEPSVKDQAKWIKDIKPHQFQHVYTSKIVGNIENEGKMEFRELKVLLNAYEFYQYTKDNEDALENIEKLMKKMELEDQLNERFHDKQTSTAFLKRLKRMQSQKNCKEFVAELKQWCRSTLQSPQYEFFLNSLTMIMFFTITMKRVGKIWQKSSQDAWCSIQYGYNICVFLLYFIEILVVGFRKTLATSFRIWPELICQLMFWYQIFTAENIVDSAQYKQVRIFELIIFMRLFKMITLMYELKQTRIFIETMRNLVQPILIMLSSIFIVYYIYSLVGMYMFGGRIRSNLPEFANNDVASTFYANNFNDFFSSMCTLFSQMVVNNWAAQCDMYTAIMGSNLYRIYFLSFSYFSVIIAVNLVVAYILDMYSSVERLEEEKELTMEIYERKLRKYEKKLYSQKQD